ncbi:MAG: hypothetical protein ACSLFQ_05225 [Thermoanaerobaculia bacterium]
MHTPRLLFAKPVRFPFEISFLPLANEAIDPDWVVLGTNLRNVASPDWTYPAESDDSTGSLGGWRDRADVLVALPGGLRFLILPDQHSISYEGPSDTPLDALRHTLINNVFPIALALTGELVLHAAVIGLDGSSLAFAGPSGAGKSTLAAYLSHLRGGDLLADDGALVEWREDAPFVTPGHSGFRLWPDSFGEIFPTADPNEVMDSTEKCTVAISEPAAPPTTRLTRLFILASCPAGSPPSIQVPSLKDAMLLLAESVFRGNIHSRELLAREFRSLERLVSTGIVRVLRYSKRYEELPEIADMLGRDCEALTG